MDSKKLGILGEKIAENFLENKGYQILDKNYSKDFISGPQRGEIDIVARKATIISFVEVKALTENGRELFSATSPEEKFNFGKKRKIIKMAESWLMEKKIPLDCKWQIDVISVRINLEDKKAKISHFKNV
jgi:putative endonuclease